MNKTVLLIFLFMLTPLTAGCGTFTSPEIKGKVIDAETGKTLADVNVKAVWTAGKATMAGIAGIKDVKTYKTLTDANGEFVLPSVTGRKGGIIFGTYEGVYILVYKLGYRAAHIEALGGRLYDYGRDERKPNFILKPLKTEEDYYDGYEHTSWGIVGYDHYFQIEYLYDYIARFPDSKRLENLYIIIASQYDALGEYEKEREVYEKMQILFPDSKFAIEELKLLKKKGVIK